MVELALFNFSVLFDENIRFVSIIKRPLDQCMMIKEYISDPKNKDKFIDMPFINGELSLTFEELKLFISIEISYPYLQNHDKYMYNKLIDEYTAKYIYDELLKQICV